MADIKSQFGSLGKGDKSHLLFASLDLVAADTRRGMDDETRACLKVVENHAGTRPDVAAYVEKVKSSAGNGAVRPLVKPHRPGK